MKKKLEADLISIAHRVLKLKNKDDVHQLHREAQNLYEKLSVLVFVEDNLTQVTAEYDIKNIEAKLDNVDVKEEKILVGQIEDEVEEKTSTIETKTEEIEPIVIIEETKLEEVVKESKKQIAIDDLLSSLPTEPVFERVDNSIPEPISKIIEDKIEETASEKVEEIIDVENKEELVVETKKVIEEDIFAQPKEIFFEKIVIEKPSTNLNDKLNKGFNITLNDRIAFEKNLFDGSTEDLNRVLSQIGTLSSYQEAKDFIDEMVKPDYNGWKGKEEFSERFMEFVESKFV